jgi:hypothetical protein
MLKVYPQSFIGQGLARISFRFVFFFQLTNEHQQQQRQEKQQTVVSFPLFLLCHGTKIFVRTKNKNKNPKKLFQKFV